jgi:CheY-like chemotaxis protein
MRVYVVTAAGRQAWESQDAAVPEDYRRLLWLIDVQGDTRAIRSLLRQHPEQLVRDWLRELVDLRMVESRERGLDLDTTFPLVMEEPAPGDGAEASAALSSTGAYLVPREENRVKPKAPQETTILIVEDDPDQLALADLRVSAADYNVRTASSLEELTRQLLEEGPPDLLLLDVMLPDGNGFDVLAKLRRHPKFSALPIVMLTAVNDAEHVATGLALGADGYVTKPYSKNILVGVIKGVLGTPP